MTELAPAPNAPGETFRPTDPPVIEERRAAIEERRAAPVPPVRPQPKKQGRAILKKRREARRLKERLALARTNRGDCGDGGLALFDTEGALIQYAPAAVTEGVRRLVGRLEASESGVVPPVVAVTAALSGEGSTFVSRSLGAVLAYDLCCNVLVIDFSWTDRDRSNVVGLAEVLEGSVPLEQALVATGIDGLTLLPSGAASVSRRTMLARSPALTKMLSELRTLFDFVILDLPAVQLTSDALALAPLADGIIMVVQQGGPTEAQVEQALGELSHLQVLGVVLNKWSSPVPKRLLEALTT